jgi:hypothetical protein
MKVYKVVGPYEVEKHTMDGWALDKVLGHSYADKVQCQTPVAVQVPDNCYGGITQHPRDEVVQVHEPLFLLVKDIEIIQKELFLTQEVADVRKRMEVLQVERDRWELTAKNLQADLGVSKESNKIARERWDEHSAKAQKLERDIAKLRVALGDLRMKEILE